MRDLLPPVAVPETDNKEMISRSRISPRGNELSCASKGRKDQDIGARPTQSLQASCCNFNFNMALTQLQHGTYTTSTWHLYNTTQPKGERQFQKHFAVSNSGSSGEYSAPHVPSAHCAVTPL